MIKDNLDRINSDISAICESVGVNPNEIALIGVTKYTDAGKVTEAIEAGLTHIGENKVQEARDKFFLLGVGSLKVTKHLIGHLQTNKVKQAVEIFDLIQSVDSLRLAQEIARQAQRAEKPMDILIQVNTAQEKQKSGLHPDELMGLMEQILLMEHVRVLGLMTIAPLTDEVDTPRQCFRDLRILRDTVNEQFASESKIRMKYLSMGMSNDYRIAIEEGANMLRIGRAIFQ